jgi:colanic acid biosynthesis glycosyl transferase WcaI
MRILIMAQCYSPEEVSGGVLVTELATDLVKQGHRVTVVTSAPNYPYGRVYPGYRNRLCHVEWLDGVRVVRTWSYISPQKTFWRRIFNYGSQSATAFYGGLLAGKPAVIVIFSPPLPMGLSAWMLSCLWRVPWVLQLEDLYPEAAMAAGVLRNRIAIKFFLAVERFLYERATQISLISESFRKNLLGKGVPAEKITLIPVWADPDLVPILPKENNFRKQHGLEGKFVVMYAGNHGITSCLEDVLWAAEQLRDDPNIRFIFIGEGVKKSSLQEESRLKGLENVLFLPYQPRGVFPEMLAAADLSIVTLNKNSFMTSLPSKTFNIMASARPILAVAPPESDLARLIEESECGVTVSSRDSRTLAEVILKLKQEDHQSSRMGHNGRIQLETKFCRARCVRMYEKMLQNLGLHKLRQHERWNINENLKGL